MVTSAKVKVRGVEATTDGRTWSCSDKYIEQLLNRVASYSESVQTAVVHPAADMAVKAVELLGGEVLYTSETPPIPEGEDVVV